VGWLYLGCLFAALNLVAALSSRLLPRTAAHFSHRIILVGLPVTLCASFLLMAALPNWAGVLLFFAHQVPFGLHWALVQHFVNHRVTGKSRATALSLLSLAGRVSFALWIPVVGPYQLAFGTPATYLLVGAIALVLTVAWCAPALGGRLLPREGRSTVVPPPGGA
jgi:MFS family permease